MCMSLSKCTILYKKRAIFQKKFYIPNVENGVATELQRLNPPAA